MTAGCEGRVHRNDTVIMVKCSTSEKLKLLQVAISAIHITATINAICFQVNSEIGCERINKVGAVLKLLWLAEIPITVAASTLQNSPLLESAKHV